MTFKLGWRWVLMGDAFKPGWRIVRWVLMGDDRGDDL